MDIFIAACSSGAHSNLTPPINSASYMTFRGSPLPGEPAHPRRPANHARETRAETLDDARRAPDSAARDVWKHPGREAVLAGQGPQDPRSAPGGAAPTWPCEPCSPHTFSVGLPGHHIPAYRVDASKGPAASSAWVSGRMSIRHPVSLAAGLAFCPSLPMASESW